MLLLIISLSPKGSEDVQSQLVVVIGKQTYGDPRLAYRNKLRNNIYGYKTAIETHEEK